jgi:adenylate cyclase
LEGSVRKAGDDLRITAQLIDVDNDEHLWSQDYDRKFENVFSLQKEIAQKVADSLQVTILAKESSELGRKPTQSLEAYSLYLKGRSYRQRFTLDSFKRTIDYCEQAIQKDPNYAHAYAEIANCYSYIGILELLPSHEAFALAERFAEKAIQLDPSVPESHLALGLVLLNQKWDFRGAEIEIRRALLLNPNFADGHVYLAFLFTIRRRFDEIVLECKHALELDPMSAWTCTWTGELLLFCHQIDEAVELLRNAIELEPKSAMAHNNLGLAYFLKGMIEEGIFEIKLCMDLTGGNDVMEKNDLAFVYARAGKMDEARHILADILEMEKRGHGSEVAIAGVYHSLGENSKAMEWLERAYERHAGFLVAINFDLSFEDFRPDPRFQALLKKIGFPDTD